MRGHSGLSIMIIFYHLKNFFPKENLSQFIEEIYKYLLLRCIKSQIDYPQILLCKTFLKLKVTTIILIMNQHFPQEILKQLDMDYRLSFTWQITTLNKFKATIKI